MAEALTWQSLAAPLGIGVGLRNCHFETILRERPAIDWFEAISENFMDSAGRPRAVLRQLAQDYPLVLHGVSLSLGSADTLDLNYLRKLKALADEIQPRWISDHLCWTGVSGINSHDLLPLPLNPNTLAHLIPRIQQVQDYLQRPLVLENPSTYLRFRDSTISEPAFLRALCEATGCRLLLDVNNVYVSCFNAGLDPQAWLAECPFEYVQQFHLAGHRHCGSYIIDTHDAAVSRPVWMLFHQAWQQAQQASVLLEWDGEIPSLEHVHQEALRARDWMQATPPAENTSGAANPPVINAASKSASVLSTPLQFMLPEILHPPEMTTELR